MVMAKTSVLQRRDISQTISWDQVNRRVYMFFLEQWMHFLELNSVEEKWSCVHEDVQIGWFVKLCEEEKLDHKSYEEARIWRGWTSVATLIMGSNFPTWLWMKFHHVVLRQIKMRYKLTVWLNVISWHELWFTPGHGDWQSWHSLINFSIYGLKR